MVPLFKVKTAEQSIADDLERSQTIEAETGQSAKSRGLTEKFMGSNALMNFLMVLFALSLLVIVITLVLCCKYVLVPACPSCFRGLITKIEHKLFWNSLLRAFMETYLSSAIFFFFSLNRIETFDAKGKTELLTWLAMGLVLFLFPIQMVRFLLNRREELYKQVNRQRYGSLYQNVDVYKGPVAISYSFYFCLRRLIFALIVTHSFRTIVMQVFWIDFLTTALLVYYIQVLPMEDKINNFIQILNELVVLLSI